MDHNTTIEELRIIAETVACDSVAKDAANKRLKNSGEVKSLTDMIKQAERCITRFNLST